MKKTNFLKTIPVLPSLDIHRDVNWYTKKLGFHSLFHDEMYAVLKREELTIHLQWHADTPDDPLLGGSVVRIWVDDVEPIFAELVAKGTVSKDKLQRNTPWQTDEFGLYDLNKNALFFAQQSSE